MENFSGLVGWYLVMGMLLLPQCSCPVEEDPLHTLQIPVRLENPSGRYKVGEVLWLETQSLGTEFTDAVSGQKVEVPYGSFSFNTRVVPRETVLPLVHYPFEFLLDTISGSYRPGTYLANGGSWGQSLHFEYGCFNGPDPYRVRLGVKFNYPGIYKLQLPASEVGYPLMEQECEEEYHRNYPYLQLLYVFDHKDMHLDLFNKAQAQATDPSDPDVERTEIKALRAFWLEVER